MQADPPGSDRIEITGLVVTTIVGALPHEREQPQPVRLDVTIHADLADAGHTDELVDTVDYGAVTALVAATAREAKDVLLERLAQRVAEAVLAAGRVEGVTVSVTKLRPPIPEQLEATSVRIVRSRAAVAVDDSRTHVAIVSLGSNLGDREAYLSGAVAGLGDVIAVSDVYETAPVGGPAGQGPYLNMVAAVRTSLDPYAFLRRCQRLEAAAMRQRVVEWGPRTLDVDVLFYDDVTIDDPDLMLPHPRLAERRFVLAPLAEVAPERCPPGWDDTLPVADVVRLGPLAP